MGIRIPPLNINIMLGPNPPKSRILVRRLALLQSLAALRLRALLAVVHVLAPGPVAEVLQLQAPAALLRGECPKAPVLNVLPDPGALNSCMHTYPEKNHG